MSHRRRLVPVFLINLCAVAFVLSTPALADPPTRVGRIGGVDGAVTVTGPEPTSPEVVSINYPVAAGMRFSSVAGSRAELDFGTVSARIDGRTDIEILALDEKVLGLRLTVGSVDVRVRKLGEGERVTVGTSDGQVVLTEAGAYRIDAPGPGASSAGNAPFRAMTHVAVFQGIARIHSPHGSDDVFAGEAVDIDSPRGNLRYSRADSIWLDDWAAGREREIAAAAVEAAKYVDTGIAGADELSDAGTWEETEDYGTVWYPDTVPVNWAPYQYGVWTWVAPWGWTWVDDQRWGFVPFHYGRWVHHRGRWGWSPGDRRHRHIYAPALVSFVGKDHHNRRVRPNGWIPLRPGETYTPPYKHGGTYVRDLNAGHGGRNWDGKGGRNNGPRDGNGAWDNTTNRNTVITTTIRTPGTDDHDGERRHRRRTGNDNSAPIIINDENIKRGARPPSVAPNVLAPVGGVTPMTVNPAGNPPAPPGPSPLVPRTDSRSSTQDMNDRDNGRRRYWDQGNPDFRNAERPSPRTPTQTNVATPQVITAPNVVPNADAIDTSDVGRVYVPRQTGNMGSAPADANAFNRFQRPNPAGPPPQMPTQVQTPPPVQQPVIQQPAVTAPQAVVPRATGNMGSKPDGRFQGRYSAPSPTAMPDSAPAGGFQGRYGRPNPAGLPPQTPNIAPTPAPQMMSPPAAQPQFVQPSFQRPPTPTPSPAFQPPAAQPPAAQQMFIPGVGHVPSNIGQGNFGQGNTGGGNTGQ